MEILPPESVDEKELDAKINDLRNQINMTVKNIESEMNVGSFPIPTGQNENIDAVTDTRGSILNVKLEQGEPKMAIPEQKPTAPKKKFTLK